MSIPYSLFLVFFLIISLLLCTLVLIQESKSMGLGGAFGSSDSSNSLFGTTTAEIVKKITAWFIGLFLVTGLTLSLWTNCLGKREEGPNAMQQYRSQFYRQEAQQPVGDS
jgi:preprotein translocase subunit SecG